MEERNAAADLYGSETGSPEKKKQPVGTGC
jgi:hypothetical protein